VKKNWCHQSCNLYYESYNSSGEGQTDNHLHSWCRHFLTTFWMLLVWWTQHLISNVLC